MKRLFIILSIFIMSSQLKAQPLFTNIPSYSPNTYTCVRSVEELNNNYYFLTVSFCFHCPGSNYYEWNLFRTDNNGNILDSISIVNTNSADSTSSIFMFKSDSIIIICGSTGPHDSLNHCNQPIFFKREYSPNMQLVDSFNTAVNITIPFAVLDKVVFNSNRVYYFGVIADITTFTIPTTQIYALDTAGNFLFEKVMPEIRNYVPDAVVNDSTIFITQLIYDSLANRFRFALSKYNLDLDTLLFRIVDSNLDGSNSVLKFNGNNKLLCYSMLNRGGYSGKDTLCVDLLDLNLQLNKRTMLPTLTHNFPSQDFISSSENYRQGMANNAQSNNVFYGQNWIDNSFGAHITDTVYYDIHCLDSNLNIRWSHLYGGDKPYEIRSLYGTSDGGCLIGGIARKGYTTNDTLFPIVYKVDSLGIVTNIISLEPSAHNRFRIYPNPSANLFSISNNSPQAYSLLVWNNIGQLVFHENAIKDSSYQFTIPNGSTGVYHYKLFTADGKSSSGKLLVR